MLNITFHPNRDLLTDYGVSYYYYYIHPVASFISTLFGLINTIVLSSRDLRNGDPFFKYSFVNSAGATIYSFVNIFMFLNKCGSSICSISTSYWAKFYMVYIFHYVCNSYYFGSAFVQIVIEINVYLIISGKRNCLNNFSPYKVCAIIFGKKNF